MTRNDASMATANKRTKILKQFRLPTDIVTWLEKQGGKDGTPGKSGKTQTRLVEEALRAKMILKGAV